MIYGTLDHLDTYKGIHPGVLKGLEFLRDTDFSQFPDGRVELDGDRLFCNIMTFDTKPSNETPEHHEEYIDIQYLVSGREYITVAPLADMVQLEKADPDGDIWLYRGPACPLLLQAPRYVVVWPEDAHAPGIAVDGVPETCRKCVVKVKVDW